MRDIFVSHAVADQHLAEMVVNLLVDAIGVPPKSIFCSSLPGYGVPLTYDFNVDMRDQIQEPKLVILLMTPSYMDSAFCLMEVGATWVKSLKPLPIVVPPVTFSDVTRTVGLRQGLEITNANMLQGVRRTVLEVLNIEGHDNDHFDRKRRRWEKELSEALGRMSPSPKVERGEVDRIENENRALASEVAKLTSVNKELGRQLSALQKLRPVALVIESESRIAEDLSHFLDQQGFLVGGVARTEQEAVDLAARLKPDLITAEIVLADGSSGLGAANRIVSFSDASVIFITAYPEKLLSGPKPEPTHLVVKPYDVETLATIVKQSYGRTLSERASRDRQKP